jgi:mannose-1-phosphate guanylyltransferase/mannose-6-phosphate isomerase
MNITPVLLAGGNGTRLWPLSRKSYPKQFIKLGNDLSLFQQSALRLESSKILSFEPPITLTSSDFRFIISEQLQEVSIDPGPIIIEPDGKNTAPAILAGCLHALKSDPTAILLVSSVDHSIPDAKLFHEAIKLGLTALEGGKIVTFGIKPTRPETGYGYLQLSETSLGGPVPLTSFVEKPDSMAAEEMFGHTDYLWNAGIFLFRASDMVHAFDKFASSIVEPVKNALAYGQSDLGFWRLDPKAWSKCESVSIDYAVMEKIDNLMVVPFHGHWSDLGDWRSIWLENNVSEHGVVTQGNVTQVGCKDALLWSESGRQELVGLGLRNIVAITTPDAVLVADKDKTQDLKIIVEDLKSRGISQAEKSTIDYRPWGWFESLIIENGFQVKRICVKPGEALSLQSHQFRSEHWIVVKGTATVTVDDQVSDLTEGQSIFVPLEAVHRMENKTGEEMILIEVQTGSYLGEDDITRYEDRYRRP